jgi:sec-independent protein translocase protein TatA
MGFGGINLWQLLLVLAIVVLLFGTKKLRGVGSDLGGAIRGFKSAMKDDNDDKTQNPPSQIADNQQTSSSEQAKNKNEDKV